MTMTTPRPDAVSGRPTRRRIGVRAAGAVVTLVVVATGIVWGIHRHLHVGSAPYVDPASAAGLTFCRNGKPVTGGSTSDAPFATVVMSDQRPSGAYAAAGATAALFAYQPRQGIGPESWSGLQLSASTPYGSLSAPAVKQDRTATTLAQFVKAFPTLDAGWVQLRVVLGAPGVRAQTTAYATADVHIRGGSWTVAHPGHAACPRN